VILPAVLAQLVGYDFSLVKLARRMKCQQCGEKRVRVRVVEPGENKALALIKPPVENRGATQELVNAHDKCCQHRHPEQDSEQFPEASS
jgi:hypothetical protein